LSSVPEGEILGFQAVEDGVGFLVHYTCSDS